MMKTTKQNKVIKKIQHEDGQSVDKLKAAQKAKNDEFYTPLQDITKELFNWSDKFVDKRIVCPCDWDILADEPDVVGIHIEMDRENLTERDKKFHRTKIKKCYLIRYKRIPYWDIMNASALRNGGAEYEEIPVKDFMYKLFKDGINESRLDDLICQEVDTETAKRVTCNFIKYFLTTECKSITATGYNTDREEGIKFKEVNYNNYDICVTNPPFSIYGDFMDCMTKEKDNNPEFNYIILAPFLNRVTPNVGLPLMLKKCYLGYCNGIHINFQNPDKEHGYKDKKVLVDWLTTFSDAQDELDNSRLHNNIYYNDTEEAMGYASEYYEMENMTMKDGTHPLKIANVKAIPDDYTGWIFTTIGSLNSLSNKEFEWYGTSFMGYFNKVNIEANPFNHKVTNDMLIHDEAKQFHGIICRRRTPENGNMVDVFTGKDYSK